jgi:hypothetical protein
MKKFIIFLLIPILVSCSQVGVEELDKGNQFFDNQDYANALESYRQAEEKAPELAEPLYNASNTHYRLGDFDLAEMRAQQALQYAKDDLLEDTHFNLGNTYFNNKQYDKAVEAYTELLWQNPDDVSAKHNLELSLRMLEQQQEQEQQNQDEQQGDKQNQDEQQGDKQNQDEQQGDKQNQDEQQGDKQNQDEQQGDKQNQDEQQQSEKEQQSSGENGEEKPEEESQPQSQPSGEDEPKESGEESQIQTVRLTEEQAKQLLESIARDTETLQQYLQKTQSTESTTDEDW